ncbi:acetate/propionate family kinase [Candidatus Peregrinibacteria bacterium]|nr:acetate/propionate family kinase [Candidatus Peregrinibacteria bacterium]
MQQRILIFNSGSSSIKFAIFRDDAALERLLSGAVQRMGHDDATLTIRDHSTERTTEERCTARRHADAAECIFMYLQRAAFMEHIAGIGHRIVHGGDWYTAPIKIDRSVCDALRRLLPLAPEHLPHELSLLEYVAERFPGIPQIACFDTAFHAQMPSVAQCIPLPRKFTAKGIRRYGFHGISYAYLLEELRRESPAEADGRVIFAHLGHGASMAAVRGGKCLDTTMGFTPASGLVMGTRSGDIDPGIAWYMMKTEKMAADAFYALVNTESGLLGVSERSGDMRDLLKAETHDRQAAEAVGLFCYRIRCWLGAYCAVLGGLDTLVFSGGIGEQASVIRSRVCDGLGFLGITIETRRNTKNLPVISSKKSAVTVRVMHTDEEVMIARWTHDLLHNSPI